MNLGQQIGPRDVSFSFHKMAFPHLCILDGSKMKSYISMHTTCSQILLLGNRQFSVLFNILLVAQAYFIHNLRLLYHFLHWPVNVIFSF